mmetsp:Transcript_32918/g.52575  ORF Transcript_32918/g.52575 Transcript_32918/m.52575 type:complete len:90 (-) Transcript_32918:1720-1989(-)
MQNSAVECNCQEDSLHFQERLVDSIKDLVLSSFWIWFWLPFFCFFWFSLKAFTPQPCKTVNGSSVVEFYSLNLRAVTAQWRIPCNHAMS